MWICSCAAVSDGMFKKAFEEGHTTMRQLIDHLNICRQCGSCGKFWKEYLKELKKGHEEDGVDQLLEDSKRTMGVGAKPATSSATIPAVVPAAVEKPLFPILVNPSTPSTVSVTAAIPVSETPNPVVPDDFVFELGCPGRGSVGCSGCAKLNSCHATE